MTRNITEIQTRLIALGYLAAGEADGKFGAKSLDAYNHWRASKGVGPVAKASVTQLNIDLFPEEQPRAKPRLTPNPVVQAIGGLVVNTILNQALKGTGINMDFAKVSKAVAAGLSGAGLLGGHSVYGYISLPPDQMAALPGWLPATIVTVNAVVGFAVAFAVTYFAPANKAA